MPSKCTVFVSVIFCRESDGQTQTKIAAAQQCVSRFHKNFSKITMADRRRKRDHCIPGLVPQAFTRGSRHTAPVPTLDTAELDEETGECNFKWEAKGSLGSYEITAVGRLIMEVDSYGKPVGRGLKVTCSCPDGQRQAAEALDQNRIIVCKHGTAALESVLDEEAIAQFQTNLIRLQRQREEKASKQKDLEEAAKAEQERTMPGERSRIEYGLKAMTHDEIQKHLEDSCKTVEGLRCMAVLFPQSIMPSPQTKTCVRCHKKYDERYADQRVCRVEHPSEHCNTKWDGSKISWQHCYRCDNDFDVPDCYYGRNRPYDSGKWCFEGEHTQDEAKIEEEEWNADPCDLVY